MVRLGLKMRQIQCSIHRPLSFFASRVTSCNNDYDGDANYDEDDDSYDNDGEDNDDEIPSVVFSLQLFLKL